MLSITATVFCILILTDLLPIYHSTLLADILFFILFSTLRLVSRRLSYYKHIIACLYVFLFFLCIVAIYLTYERNRDAPAATALGVLVLIPSIIIDRSSRTELIIMISVAVLTASSWILKIPESALDDTINFFIFSSIGLIIGEYSKHNRLKLFELYRQTNKQRYRDFLTGLPNRAKLYDDIIENREKESQPINLAIMIDIDFFKKYNDTYGHQAGDCCLQTIGKCLAHFGAKHNITFYRYGGEEFIGMVSGTSYTEMPAVCSELQDRIYQLHIPFNAHPNLAGQITISQGYAEMGHNSAAGYAELINMADSALYHAKKHGRNCFYGYNTKMKLMNKYQQYS